MLYLNLFVIEKVNFLDFVRVLCRCSLMLHDCPFLPMFQPRVGISNLIFGQSFLEILTYITYTQVFSLLFLSIIDNLL